MTNEEYNKLFHRAQVNLVAFKQVNDCDDELRSMVEMAVAAEREACVRMCNEADKSTHPADLAAAIRARGNT